MVLVVHHHHLGSSLADPSVCFVTGVFRLPDCSPVSGRESTKGAGNAVSADACVEMSYSSGFPVLGGSSATPSGPCTI